ARKQAEKFSWWNTTQRMLRIHGIEVLEDEFAA
ncbi:MAG: hypothetical protein RL581_1376, partial [Actinomycetota bacterium]